MNFKSKRLIKIAMVTILCFIIVGIVAFKSVIDKPLKIVSDYQVTIDEGESFYSLLNELKSEGVIKNTVIIKAYTKINRLNLDIIPGQYIMNKDMSIKDIIELLKRESEDSYINFTIPEGFTIDDIAEKLENEGICKSDQFMKHL